jgi:diguanylate cyclase (GGDEF)-like protein
MPGEIALNADDRAPLPLRGALTAVGLAVVAPVLIGLVDLANGPEYGLSLFYLVPIVAVAFRLGTAAAITAALVSAVAGFLAAYFWFGPSHTLLSAWDGLSSLAIYLALGLASARLRADRNELHGLNARLQEMLLTESGTARTDALTGLPNSRALHEHLQRQIARARRDGTAMAVMVVDLDNFKRINDQEGHAAGDAVLRQVAEAMRDCIRAGDLAARFGGDEFALVLSPVQPRDAEAVADRLLASMAVLRQAHPDSDIGASIGIAWFDRPPSDPDAALRRADQAMYVSKVGGKGRHTTDADVRAHDSGFNTPR